MASYKSSQAKTNYCQGCGQNFSADDYIKHQEKIKEHAEHVICMQDLLAQKSKVFISELSTYDVLNLITSISKYNLKLDETKRTTDKLQQQLQNFIRKDQENLTDGPKFNQNADYFENDIERLKKDIEKLELELQDISNTSQKQLSSQNETDINYEEKGQQEDGDEDEMIVFLDSNIASKISHKVKFSNNIVRWLRGPIKLAVQGTMHAVDIASQGAQTSNATLQAVTKGLDKQKQYSNEEQISNNFIKPAFTEITSDWEVEGENPDRGYSSPSIWMRDSQHQRLLLKVQEHPICAANEWLAYVLGKVVGLPINEVQIAIYENNLVTLHADVESEDEKTITFMDLPKDKRDLLMTNPILESMEIFDFIIQNVDRNQQNILITIPKSADINDKNLNEVKVHLIDHASSFGMGKLNAISLVAAKFHSNHFAVVKFDPIHQSKRFEEYLNKLPIKDRPLISKTLNRFASITNDQFDGWITQIQDLLTPNQYNRIYGVLHRQRDIAKNCLLQWNTSSGSSSITEQNNSQT